MYRWRKRLEGLWLLVVIAGGLFALDTATDFDVRSGEWWLYLVKVAYIEQRAPTPYIFYLGAIPIVWGIGVLLSHVAWRPKVYGDARFAKESELAAMGLRGKAGMVLGQVGNKLLICDKPRHSLVVTGTRTGKTTGIVMPTLFSYPGSVLVIDPKGELWDQTAGHRATFTDCLRLEWTARDTARYNPISLSVLPEEPDRIVQRLAQLSTVLGPTGNDYWTKEARSVLNALMVLEVFDAKREMREALLTNVAHWSGEFDDGHLDDKDNSPLQMKLWEAANRAKVNGYPRGVVTDLTELAGTNHKQLIGVFRTLGAELQVLRSAAVEHSLSGCDFTARSLVEGDRPTSLYVVIRPDDREFVAPLTTALLTNIAFNLVSRSAAEAAAAHPLLMLVEEFSALRATSAIPEIFDRGAGLGVHAMIVLQAFSQAISIYSKETFQTFQNNADFIVALQQNNEEQAAQLERMTGKTTRERESRSDDHAAAGGRISDSLEGVSLVLAQEYMTMPVGQHFVLVRGYASRPVKAKTPFFFDNARMARQAKISPPGAVGAGVMPPTPASENSAFTGVSDGEHEPSRRAGGDAY